MISAADIDASALSPEAEAARAVYARLAGRSLAEAVRQCGSGQELIAAGYADDVEVALEVDADETVPLLMDGCFVAAAAQG